MNQLPLTTLDQSKALRDCGFDWPCHQYFVWYHSKPEVKEDEGSLENHNRWDNLISRPTIALALQWMRQTHGIHGWVQPEEGHNDESDLKKLTTIFFAYGGPVNNLDFIGDYEKWEEAEAALLTELLKIITALKTEKA